MTGVPEPYVEPIRYAVSLLEQNDVNYSAYVLYVQRCWDRGERSWGITDGAGWVSSRDGRWTLDRYDALTFTSLAKALVLARKLAPTYGPNGRTAIDAYRLTHPDKEN